MPQKHCITPVVNIRKAYFFKKMLEISFSDETNAIALKLQNKHVQRIAAYTVNKHKKLDLVAIFF